jgi:hypothetical protein
MYLDFSNKTYAVLRIFDEDDIRTLIKHFSVECIQTDAVSHRAVQQGPIVQLIPQRQRIFYLYYYN